MYLSEHKHILLWRTAGVAELMQAEGLNSEDPSVRGPYIRERRVIGLADADYDALILPSR
jgi:hypothetical protein